MLYISPWRHGWSYVLRYLIFHSGLKTTIKFLKSG